MSLRLASILAVFASSLFLAACQDDSGDDSGGDTGGGEESSTESQ